MTGRCRRACCWTPWGHSTVRDGQVRESLRCRCHDEAPSYVARPPAPGRVREVRPCPAHHGLWAMRSAEEWPKVVSVASGCRFCVVVEEAD